MAAAIAVPWIWAGRREKPLTQSVRRKYAPGQTLRLSVGSIYYTDSGDKDAPVIVMVHGFSVPHFVFEQNAVALVSNGFRVIQFDHFGRGWSDRPAGRYDTNFYDGELTELFDVLQFKTPVGLVGYSMGGVIAAEFAALHPERLTGVFLLAPAGFSRNLFSNPVVRGIMRTPLLGNWYWRIFGRGLLLADPQLAQPHKDTTRCIQGDDTIQMNYKATCTRSLPLGAICNGRLGRDIYPCSKHQHSHDDAVWWPGPDNPSRKRCAYETGSTKLPHRGVA